MNQPPDFLDYLEDIQQAAQKAIAFVQGLNKDSFSSDEKTVFAVTRALEVLGEVTKRIPQSFRDQHPEVPCEHDSTMPRCGTKPDRLRLNAHPA